jgi:RHS repeat-associated protein
VDDADLEAFAAVVTGPQFGLFADGDWNSNGAVGPIDHNAFVNVCYSGPGGGFNTNGCQVFDFDGDGDVDLDDYGVLLALWYESSPNAPMTLTAADASPVNDYYFTGRSLDFVPHGGERHQRYYYRARTYNTERFMQRDPKNYIDTMNCYAYARAMPTTWYDPFGLQVLEPGVVGEPTPGFPDSNASSPTSSTTEPKPKVEVCCRKTNISCCVDMALTVVKAEHCFISTATKAAGMGPAQCGSADEESSPCCGTPTAITDHAGESSKPKVKCTALKNCDMECVNQELEIGKPTSNWSLKNNCNTLVRQVLLVCNCRNKCHRRYTERVVNRKTGDVFYIRRCISWDYDPRLPIPGHPDDADDYVTWGSS